MFTVLEIANRPGVIARTATVQPTRIQRLLQKYSITFKTAVLQEKSATLKSTTVGVLGSRNRTRFRVLAEVTGDERNLRDDMEQLKRKARAVGGDAILLRNSNAMEDRGPLRTVFQITREATIIRWK